MRSNDTTQNADSIAITPYVNSKTLHTFAAYAETASINTFTSFFKPTTLNRITSFLLPALSLFAPISRLVIDEKQYKGRQKTTFSANRTASLALPDTSSSETPSIAKRLETLDDLAIERIQLVKEFIKEHAARRVDLFFYLLLAVHGKQVVITKDATIKQHGSGSQKNKTQACHSALIPNIKMQPISSSWYRFFFSTKILNLAGTQFDDSLNMTVQLPDPVNAFDGHLEGRSQQTKYTKAAIEILNKAARNEIDPKQGMNEFLKIMHAFFSDFESKHLKKKPNEQPNQTKLIWEYEKAGTFLAANKNTQTVSDAYLYLMLRLNPIEKQKVIKNPELIQGFYKRIQEEIWTSKAEKKQSRLRP